MNHIATDTELKGLKSRLEKTKQKLKGAEVCLKEAKALVASLHEEMRHIQKRMEQIERTGDIIVSEHAMLRYLERVKGVNVVELQQEIIGESDDHINAFGTCEVKRDGYTL